MTIEMQYIAPSETRIGHVHLKVSDLQRSLKFYCDILGFELMQMYGSDAAFLSAGGYHHHIGLNTWFSKGRNPPGIHSTGLFHVAILYPSRKALGLAYKRIIDAGYPLKGASDHGVSEAIYLSDPDKNGLELYCDKPESDWPRKSDGSLNMINEPLNPEDLLKELD